MFTLLRDREVPVLVFSAGMGDILVRVLDRYSLRHDNVKIVSNFFKYDDKVSIYFFPKNLTLLKITSTTGTVSSYIV